MKKLLSVVATMAMACSLFLIGPPADASHSGCEMERTYASTSKTIVRDKYRCSNFSVQSRLRRLSASGTKLYFYGPWGKQSSSVSNYSWHPDPNVSGRNAGRWRIPSSGATSGWFG